jgi:hypothetical protein
MSQSVCMAIFVITKSNSEKKIKSGIQNNGEPILELPQEY